MIVVIESDQLCAVAYAEGGITEVVKRKVKVNPANHGSNVLFNLHGLELLHRKIFVLWEAESIKATCFKRVLRLLFAKYKHFLVV